MGTLNEDLDNIKAIEDKLTANKVANFAYTDHAYNNPLTEADGVTNYNVNNEQNIPVADASIMNVNDTVLTKGWRSQASAITRMLMNHFLGRVSYNLNKLNDNMSALLTTLRANLSNVVNTGDSADVSSGGTTKFTTGGAYNLLSSIAPYFSTSATYAVGALLTYQNRLYECTTAHSAGAWKANHFTARSVQYVINNYILPSLAPAFSTSTSYAVGDFVIYQNKLYRCTVAHSGAWNSSDFTLVTVGSDFALKADKTSLAAPSDAVLHYSFDDVPDYPDGTSISYYNKDFTTVGWNLLRGSISVNNNMLKVQSTSTTNNQIVISRSGWTYTNLVGKIVKLKVFVHQESTSGNCYFIVGGNSILVSKLVQKESWNELSFIIPTNSSETGSEYLGIQFSSSSTDNYFILESIYIGDGSYVTPIIDNANGQNNAVNNGGIAVQGVSGKGAYFLNGKYVQASNFNFAKNFTVSVWIKPDNADNNLYDNILFKNNVLYLRNGGSSNNYFYVAIYNPNTSSWQYITTTELLPINKYTHIVLVKNGTNIKLYYDASLKKNATIVEDVNTNNQPLNISNSNNTRSQSIDDLLIFDRALSDTEVLALYLNKANTPKFYNINNYILDNTDSTPTQDSTNLVTSGGIYTELAKKVDKTTTVNGHALSGNVTVTKADLNLDDVVNTGDSDTPVSGGTTKFTTGGAYTELAKKVDKTTTVNGHALSDNVTVTKADLNLDDVVNTGDSATPVSGGTTKFTTGGAYTELNKKFDKTSAGDQVTYSLSGNTLTITSK